MKACFTFVLFFVSGLLFAQENYTIKASNEGVGVDYILLPFDPNYYISDVDIDIEIGQYNKMKSLEIREYFRNELDLKLFTTIKNDKKIKSMLMSGGSNTIKDFSYVIDGIKYEYVLLEFSAQEKTEKPQKNKNKGQLSKKSNSEEKYMRAVCSNKDIFNELIKKNNTNYIISINQFELKNSFSSQLDIQQSTHKKKISVHYNILDKAGKTVYGGISTSEFDNSIVDIKEITRLNFDVIAKEILSHLTLLN